MLLCPAALASDDTTVFVPESGAKRLIQIADAPNPGGDAVTVNVLAVYSTRLAAQLRAQGYAVADYILRSYTETNRHFQATGLRTRVRLAGLAEWALPAGGHIGADMAQLIDQVERQTELRDAFAADLVQLWEVTEAGIDDPAICGWGQTIGPERLISDAGFGYSAMARGQPDGNLAGCYAHSAPEEFALLVSHEIGHNLGSAHGWGEDSGEGAYAFSHAQLCGERINGHAQGTLMSKAGYRLPFFSSPALQRDGQPCGVPAGQPYAADNRETFTRTAGAVAGLRRAVASSSRLSAEIPARIGELSGSLPVVLRRSDSRGAARVELLVFGESARNGEDFNAPARQAVAFADGEAVVTVSIPLLADRRSEDDETLLIWLQRPENLVIDGGQGFRIRLIDNLLSSLLGLIAEVGQALPLPGSDILAAEPVAPSASPPGTAQPPATEASGGSAGSAGIWLILIALAARADRSSRAPGAPHKSHSRLKPLLRCRSRAWQRRVHRPGV